MIGRKRTISRLTMCKKKNIDLEIKTKELPFKEGHKWKTNSVHDNIIFSRARGGTVLNSSSSSEARCLGLAMCSSFWQASRLRMDETTKLGKAKMDRCSTAPLT